MQEDRCLHDNDILCSVITQAVRCWLLTAELWVQNRITSYEICGGRNDIGEEFSEILGFSSGNQYYCGVNGRIILKLILKRIFYSL
jgi:hypothetical protein